MSLLVYVSFDNIFSGIEEVVDSNVQYTYVGNFILNPNTGIGICAPGSVCKTVLTKQNVGISIYAEIIARVILTGFCYSVTKRDMIA